MSEYKLFEAIRENNIEKIKNFTNINAKDYFGYTALMRAASKGDLEIVKYLTENIENIINDKTVIDGSTALMFASKEGHLEIVKYLLENGADVNIKDNFGETALIWASREGYFEIVKCLVESGADINAKNSSGWTALMGVSSWKNGHLGIVKYLLKNGADINAKDNNGNTALIKASKFGKLEIIKYLVEDKRLDINIKNNNIKKAIETL